MSTASNIASDVAPLMRSLGRLDDRERIIEAYLEAVNSGDWGIRLRAVDGGREEGAAYEEIATRKANFGRIVFESVSDEISDDVLAMLRVSVRMLALILEEKQNGDRQEEAVEAGSEGHEHRSRLSREGLFGPDDRGGVDKATAADVRDVEREAAERETTLELMRVLNAKEDLRGLIKVVLGFMKKWSGCEAVGIRLHDGDDYPYYETRGFDDEFVEAERYLCQRDVNGQLQRDEAGNPVLECMCGNVICGRFDPSLPFFTEKGSFFSNCTTELLASTTEKERQARTRNRCNGEGYESVALTPLRVYGENLGLMQFNDRRRDRFTEDFISTAERLAEHVSSALYQRKAEQELRQSEERLALALNVSGAGVWRWNVKNGEVVLDDKFHELLGYGPGEAPRKAHEWKRLHHPAGYTATAEKCARCIRGEDDVYSNEHRLLSKNGEWRWFFTRGQIIDWDADGTAVLFAGVALDVTDRKRIETELRESEEFLKQTGETAKVGGWRIDLESRNVSFTRTTSHILGIAEDELMGLSDSIAYFYDSDDRERIRTLVGRAIEAGESYDFEANITTGKGRRIWIRAIGIPTMEDGKCVRLSGVLQDITDYKEGEAALRESEERYRAVAEDTPVLICRYLPGGEITYVNPAYCDYFGKSLDELVGSSFLTLVSEDDRDLVLKGLSSLTADSPSQSHEHRVYGSDGEIRWQRWTNRALFDAEGKVTAYLSIGEDVTERKRAVEALRASEKMWHSLFENTNFGMLIFKLIRDESGRAVDFERLDVNPAAARHTGWPVERLKGKLLSQLAPLEDTAGNLALCDHTARTGESWRREVYAPMFGRTLDMATFSLGGDMLASTFSDISDRKLAEAALLSEKQLSEEYINSLPGLFYVFDEERFIRWNRAWEEITGYSSEELATKYPPDFFSGLDKTCIIDAMQRAFKNGTAEAEAELVVKDGRRIPYYFTGQLCTINGKAHLIGLGLDVTDRKRAESQRRELEEQLRQSQKMEAIGQLAGGVAHDFNNILTAILGNVELSLDMLRQEFGEEHEVVQSLQQIDESSRRASALTRQLLTFSRRGVSQPKILNVNEVLIGMDNMLRRLVTEEVKLRTVFDPNLKAIQADYNQLEQVILNFVINAVQAMPDGGRLTLETQNVTLDEDYTNMHAEARLGEHVLLAVSDTGCGMEADVAARIFEPFFTTKPINQGTGLGLATVHGIVRQSGGHVMVYTEPGRGSTFKAYFPTIKAKSEQKQAEESESQAAGGHDTILLCEDDFPVRELTARSLGSAGYHVITAANGRKGLEVAKAYEGKIDLLITDVIMPDMNGRVLSEKLQAEYPGLPTLFISGYTSNVIAHHGVLDKGVEFLSKPYSRRDLLTKVSDVLAKARAKS